MARSRKETTSETTRRTKKKTIIKTPIPRIQTETVSTRLKYGLIPPTGFISDLDNHQWILDYFPRYTWDYPELKAYRNMTDDRTIRLMHRKAGKSVSDVGIYTREFLEGIKLGVITAGSSMKSKIFRAMYYNLRSPKIRVDYGDILAKEFGGETNKTRGFMVCAGNPDAGLDPDFQITTRGGEIIGSHMDKLYLHDIIQEQFKSYESNDSLLITYEEVWQFCSDWIGGTGTRKGLDDFYAHMQKRGYKFFYRPAVKLISGRWPTKADCEIMNIYDEITGVSTEQYIDVNTSVGEFEFTGCPDWPLKRLLMKRVENEFAFESQMNNNPLARSGYFDKTHWHELEPFGPGLTPYSDYFMSVDPGYSDNVRSASADYTAILIGTVFDRKIYVVDGIIERLGFDEIIDHIEEFHRIYKVHKIRMIKNFAERWLKTKVEQKFLPIDAIQEKRNKIMRISALKPHFKAGRIISMKAGGHHHMLKREFLIYDELPSTGTKHDDGLDALAYLVEILIPYLRSYVHKAYTAID